jgi:Ca2+-binding RTX toxin-like protein
MALFVGTRLSDTIGGGAGNDIILLRIGRDMADGSSGDDIILGGNGADTLGGARDEGADTLFGGNGDDHLRGGLGHDLLHGGRGDDRLHGSWDVDHLIGGKGADTFSFGTIVGSRGGSSYEIDTGVGEGARDVICDFQQGKDIIDLGWINWISAQASLTEIVFPEQDRTFEFIGTDPFSGTGNQPQLRFFQTESSTIIQMDGISYRAGPIYPIDGVVDAEIELSGLHELTAADFIL